MKKKVFFILMLCLFLLVGCSNKEENNDLNNNENIQTEDTTSLKDPILNWCQLYNPNGFNTVTCVLSNPNNVDIDVIYDLVFYKDGREVSRQESWSNFQVSPKHSDIIWGNVEIPSSNEADEVKMENITVAKAYNNSIEADIKFIETKGNEDYFSVKNSAKPTLNNIWILLYNDKNNNKKCEKGELVVTNTYVSFEKEDTFNIDTDVSGATYGTDYNAYEIYYKAY